MSAAHRSAEGRVFTFDPTPAVAASRGRTRYVSCPVCSTDNADYLFHRTGVRFVRCRSCGVVYVNPVGTVRPNYFDIDRSGQYEGTPADRARAVEEFGKVLERLAARYEEVEKRPLRSVVLLGRWLPEFATTDVARRVGLKFAEVSDEQFAALVLQNDVSFAQRLLGEGPQLVILKEMLEACSEPAAVMERLRGAAPSSTWFAVDFSNVSSMPAMMLRKYWSRFFDYKSTFFDLNNLNALMERVGMQISSQFPYPTTRSVDYVLARLPFGALGTALRRSPLGRVAPPIPSGHYVAIYRPRSSDAPKREKLSIVLPVFNEARYVSQVLERVLAKQLKIDRELIVVESNSTDGTRDIVKTFEGREGGRSS